MFLFLLGILIMVATAVVLLKKIARNIVRKKSNLSKNTKPAATAQQKPTTTVTPSRPRPTAPPQQKPTATATPSKPRPIDTHIEQKSNEDIMQKGSLGERVSNFSTLPITAYGKQLRNLYIPTKNGATTEIDTIVITVKGIFIIETKNFNGKIYGSEEYKDWIAYYSNNKKYYFYNPIKQNNAHILAIKSLLPEMQALYIQSIIAFGNGSSIDKIIYDQEKTTIIKHEKLNETFKALLEASIQSISRETVNRIFEKLKPYTAVTAEEKEQHIKNIRARACRY